MTEIAAPIPIETARRRRLERRIQPAALPQRTKTDWAFVAMIASLCLFAVVFATSIVRPALHTVTSTSVRNWTQGP
jgi:hypothetical protein